MVVASCGAVKSQKAVELGDGRLGGGVIASAGRTNRMEAAWWNHRCWTVSWWLWHHVGVESPTAVGGFTGAGLLAGGCGIAVVPCGS